MTQRVPTTEPTPWSTGLLVSAMVAALAATAVYAFGAALARVNPALAVVVSLVAVGGVAPTVWSWRSLPVVRWVVYGAAAGVVVGWMALLVAAA